MDLILLILGGLLMILGILGSFLPVLPGIPLSWLGLLVLHLAPSVPFSYGFLIITFFIATLIFVLQLVIPALGTRRYGGSKAGMWGASIGLVAGIFIPVPFGIILGAFFGAMLGELVNNKNSRQAIRAAFGSFVGLLASTFMELMIAFGFFGLFIYKAWQFREFLF